MSQIEWFKHRNVFHKLTEQEIYLALNVQWNMEYSRDYDQILKNLYAISPQWRHSKHKRNKSPLDLLENKTSYSTGTC